MGEELNANSKKIKERIQLEKPYLDLLPHFQAYLLLKYTVRPRIIEEDETNEVDTISLE